MNIKEYLKSNILYLDGAMGTMLQEKGLKAGEHSELWNISHPNEVTDVHKAYFEAGSNVVCANTFGVNSLKYSDEEIDLLISKAYENCKNAMLRAKGGQEKFIALDIGPLGKLLKPLGSLEFEDAVEIFAKTVKAGLKHSFDLIIIETMNDIYETKAALLAVKENCSLPVFVSNAYGEDGKLVTGADVFAVCELLQSMGADAVGTNCSFGPKQSQHIIDNYLSVADIPVLMKPNAGLPLYNNGKTSYDVNPKDFANEILKAVSKGVRIVGGCCGTTPESIKAVAEITKDLVPKYTKTKKRTVVTSYTHALSFEKRPVLIGERINPTGKKRFKQALLENDIDYILKEGISQQDKGVHMLDVNVGLAGIDEVYMLTKVVKELQAICNLPLQLDSSNPRALESAMRIYNGKPLINSVNGKKESMEAIFPLIKKYGGSVIALTLDEQGIPDDADGRIKIAERILKKAEEYDISREDIIFDPLTMTVSTNNESAKITLECIKIITEKFGCKTSLGVSNISFGLPNREIINSTFFNMALCNGLSAAIVNPYSVHMMDTYIAYCALTENDENFERLIDYSDKNTIVDIQNNVLPDDDLINAVVKGRKDKSAKLTRDLMKTQSGIDIINNYIIPALNKTGEAFEQKKIYLPQLLMSAEAASAAFEEVKKNSTNSTAVKCTVILATVEGDVHDIGKNIVKLLLQNYGFNVIDLGKNVPSETILTAVKNNNCYLLGLSALMTTTLDAMSKTVALVKKECPKCKVFVGGAVVNEEYALSIGADKYTCDAMESVRYAEQIFDTQG